jgi:hypothetical protein
MSTNLIELAEQVASLKQRINNLETEYKSLVEELIYRIEEPIETAGFSITPRVTKKWQFSPNVGDLENALKIAKKQEQEDGTAIVSGETLSLVVKLNQ